MASARSRAARRRYPGLGDPSDNHGLQARRQRRSAVLETCLDMRAVTERLVAGVAAAAERDPRAAGGAHKGVGTDDGEAIAWDSAARRWRSLRRSLAWRRPRLAGPDRIPGAGRARILPRGYTASGRN